VDLIQPNVNKNLKIHDMGKVNIKPLGDRVVVEPAVAEETTASGIIIPDTAKEKPQNGTVVAVPDENKENPVTVKVGDKVLYGKYSGTEINIDGSDYLIMSEKDILAII
jgi:chaperonin GroES